MLRHGESERGCVSNQAIATRLRLLDRIHAQTSRSPTTEESNYRGSRDTRGKQPHAPCLTPCSGAARVHNRRAVLVVLLNRRRVIGKPAHSKRDSQGNRQTNDAHRAVQQQRLAIVRNRTRTSENAQRWTDLSLSIESCVAPSHAPSCTRQQTETMSKAARNSAKRGSTAAGSNNEPHPARDDQQPEQQQVAQWHEATARTCLFSGACTRTRPASAATAASGDRASAARTCATRHMK